MLNLRLKHIVSFFVLIVAFSAALGCSTRAKVTVRDGAAIPTNVQSKSLDDGRTNLFATIADGDADYVYLEARDGNEVAVSRSDIENIDHPGEWVGITGSIVLGVGVLMTGLGAWAVASTNCSNQEASDCGGLAGLVLGMGIIHLVPGLILTINGYLRHDNSADRARGTGAVSVGPAVLSHGRRPVPGAAVTVTW